MCPLCTVPDPSSRCYNALMLRKSLIALGILVALVPYLGLPRSFDTIVTTFAGTAIVVLLLVARPRADRTPGQHVPTTPVDPAPARAPETDHRRPERMRGVDERSHRGPSVVAPAKELRVERLATAQRPSRALERPGASARPTEPVFSASAPAVSEKPLVRSRQIRRKSVSAAPLTVGVIPAPEIETEVPAPTLPSAVKVEPRRRRRKTESAEVAPLSS